MAVPLTMDLDHVDLFRGLDPGELAEIGDRARVRRFPAGALLCQQGDPSDSLFVIRTGLAQVQVEDEGGQRLVNRLRRGDVVGEIGLLTGGPRTATVKARLPTEVLEIDREMVAAAFARYPELLSNLTRLFSQRLLHANARQIVRKRGEAVAVLLGQAALPWSAEIIRRTREASAWPVIAVGLAAGTPPEGVDVSYPDIDGAVADLDNLASRALVLCLAASAGPHARTLAGHMDRVVALTSEVEVDEMMGRLGPEGDRLELVLVGSRGDPGTVRGPTVATVDPSDPLRCLGWVGRHLARSKIGLALGAGGAKGFAHLGVLAALDEAGYTIDYVSGSSIGAVVGAGIAQGLDASSIERNLRRVFTEEAVRSMFSLSWGGASTGGSALRTAIDQLVGSTLFADLLIPLHVMCVDLDAKRPVVLDTGFVSDALVAATALAGLFAPYEVDGHRLVDGVALVPVPVDAVRDAGADVVVSVNLMSRDTLPAWPGEDPPAPPGRQRLLETMLEVMDLTQLDASVQHASRADVVITPRFGPCSWRDFHLADRFRDAGRTAADAALDSLASLVRPCQTPVQTQKEHCGG